MRVTSLLRTRHIVIQRALVHPMARKTPYQTVAEAIKDLGYATTDATEEELDQISSDPLEYEEVVKAARET